MDSKLLPFFALPESPPVPSVTSIEFTITTANLFGQGGWFGYVGWNGQGSASDNTNLALPSGKVVNCNAVMSTTATGNWNLRISLQEVSGGTPIMSDFPDRVVVSDGTNTTTQSNPTSYAVRGNGPQVDYDGSPDANTVLDRAGESITVTLEWD